MGLTLAEGAITTTGAGLEALPKVRRPLDSFQVSTFALAQSLCSRRDRHESLEIALRNPPSATPGFQRSDEVQPKRERFRNRVKALREPVVADVTKSGHTIKKHTRTSVDNHAD